MGGQIAARRAGAADKRDRLRAARVMTGTSLVPVIVIVNVWVPLQGSAQ